MNIINNLSSNHYQALMKIAKGSDTLYIVSPFLVESFDPILHDLKEAGVKTIHLITKLKDNDLDLFKKRLSLQSFCDICSKLEIDYQIYIDKMLHGKLYIASDHNINKEGILTSANLTDSGLSKNHEWGLLIKDTQVLDQLLSEVFSDSSSALSDEQIAEIVYAIESYESKEKEPSKPKINLSVEALFNDCFPPVDVDKNYFLKPIGWTSEPYPRTKILSDDIETLHFARHPRSVCMGDILICYAVGSTKLLGFFEVISDPAYSKDIERWPWEVQGENCCPGYSQKWASFSHTLSAVHHSFGVEKIVTNVGGKTLGALRYGADKIQITNDFASHLMNTMNSSAASSSASPLDARASEIGRILVKRCLTEEELLITYGALVKLLSFEDNPNNIDHPLGDLSELCKSMKMPLLSAMVINRDDNRPGNGFYKQFFPSTNKDQWTEIFLEQYKNIKEFKNWDELSNLL